MKWRHAAILNLTVLKKENIACVLLINTIMYLNLVRKNYFIASKFCPIKKKKEAKSSYRMHCFKVHNFIFNNNKFELKSY